MNGFTWIFIWSEIYREDEKNGCKCRDMSERRSPFPPMESQGNVKRRTNLAASYVDHSKIRPGNLRAAAAALNRRLGLPRGSSKGRITPHGNLYIETKHTVEVPEGWGGEESELLTHLSAHAPLKDDKSAPIGSHHVRTTSRDRRVLLAQARIDPLIIHGEPNFRRLVTVEGKGMPRGYENNESAEVARQQAILYTEVARRNPSEHGLAELEAKHWRRAAAAAAPVRMQRGRSPGPAAAAAAASSWRSAAPPRRGHSPSPAASTWRKAGLSAADAAQSWRSAAPAAAAAASPAPMHRGRSPGLAAAAAVPARGKSRGRSRRRRTPGSRASGGPRGKPGDKRKTRKMYRY